MIVFQLTDYYNRDWNDSNLNILSAISTSDNLVGRFNDKNKLFYTNKHCKYVNFFYVNNFLGKARVFFSYIAFTLDKISSDSKYLWIHIKTIKRITFPAGYTRHKMRIN